MSSVIDISSLVCWQEEGEDDERTLSVPDEISEETSHSSVKNSSFNGVQCGKKIVDEGSKERECAEKVVKKKSSSEESKTDITSQSSSNTVVSSDKTTNDDSESASSDTDKTLILEDKSQETEPPKLPKAEMYDVNREFNKKIKIYKGDITRLNVDCVVNPTNSSLTARTAIMRIGGETMLEEAMLKAEEEPDLTTGDTTAMRVYDETLPFRFVLHTIAPRWRDGFEEAAEHALFSCYRNCLLRAKENDVETIAIPELSKYFPPDQAARILSRTLRKFMDRQTSRLKHVILVLGSNGSDSQTFAVHLRRNMRLYFPRSDREVPLQMETKFQETENMYDKDGARVLKERSIRITGTFAPMGGKTKEKLEAYRLKQKKRRSSSSSSFSEKNTAESRKWEPVQGPLTKYKMDIVPLNWIYPSGNDDHKRPVLVVNGAHLPVAPASCSVDMQRAMMYAVQTVKEIATRPYVVVYTHSNFVGERNMPEYDWLHRLHMNLPREQRKLLHKVYVLHGDIWLKLRFWVSARLYTNVSSKLWNKIGFVETISSLREKVRADDLTLPMAVYRYQRKL